MEISLSEFLGKSIKLPSGELTSPQALLIAAETGKSLGVKVREGFLSVEEICATEDEWSFSGEIQTECPGDNWYKFRVQNKKGVNRGKVSELWVEITTLAVTKIECTKTFFGFFTRKRIFPRDDIFQVLSRKKLIIVEEESRVLQKAKLKMQNFDPLPGMTSARS